MLIYKIISPNTDLVYVGSTIKTLRKCLADHHYQHKGWLAGKRYYCTSFKVLEHGDCSIELIEEAEHASRKGYWIRELNACNHILYQHPNKASRNKAHYEEKRDGILERMREKIPCDNCGRIVCRSSMTAHKETKRCVNNEPIREKAETIACDNCGRIVTRHHMSKHKRTKICQNTASTE